MSRLRIGKDFVVKWNIYKREEDIREAYDLTGKDILFEYSTPYGRKRIENFKVAGNTIEWTFLGKDQVYLGSYTLFITENPGKEGMITVDSCKAFVLVRHTCEEELEENENITIQTIELESDVILAPSVVYVGDGNIKVDSTLSTTSTNAIQNKAVTNALNKKQDIITDLATIRAGAEKGSTALQREQYTGTYSKPSSGIPKSDLASAVQSSLNKADTALQVETYKGTVTGVKMNGQTKGTSGVVDLGTVLTQHQDLSSKQDKLVSGTNIKTINGKSLLGSGNITIEGGSGEADLTGYATESWVEGKGYAFQSEVEEDLATKQDKITDLATIRSGAALGATSVQNTEIAKVAKSGSYNDLTNKPTIPAAVTESTVSNWGFAKSADLEAKEDKPIVFDPAAANITVGNGDDIDGSFTAAQLQAATGMAPADFTAAILSGRKVCVSLSQGTTILMQMAYILDASGIQLTFSDGVGNIIVVLQVGYSSGEGSINLGSILNYFYTKDDVDYRIAIAITSTLNTAV